MTKERAVFPSASGGWWSEPQVPSDLARRAFGLETSSKVPSEVAVQCFHWLDREHFPPQVRGELGENQDKSIDAGVNDTAILPVLFIESLPRRSR
jgi:hypothetical protein